MDAVLLLFFRTGASVANLIEFDDGVVFIRPIDPRGAVGGKKEIIH
jgi:hypothetical protein